MTIVAYQTDAVIITNYGDLKRLIDWSNGPMAEGLIGKKVIIVESDLGTMIPKKPENYESSIDLLCHLVTISSKFNLDIVFILNKPEYLDPRIKSHLGSIKRLK